MRTTVKMGLTSWDQIEDPYNYAQLAANWQIVDYHDHSPGHGVPVAAGGIAPGAVLSDSVAAGVVGLQHLSLTVLQDLGLNGSGSVGRGSFAKAAADTTASASFVSLGDQVASVVLTTGGFIEVGYHALWKTSAGTATADLFLGGVEVASGTSVNGAPAPAPATTTATKLSPLYALSPSLATTPSTTSDASEVTTGETFGGSVRMWAAAGTYTVGVQFKVSGGTLTVQNRHLWAVAYNFG